MILVSILMDPTDPDSQSIGIDLSANKKGLICKFSRLTFPIARSIWTWLLSTFKNILSSLLIKIVKTNS